MKLIYRVREVCEMYGMSRASIYRLMKQNQFPKPIRIGLRAVGWDADDLVVWYGERKLAAMV